MHTFGVEVTLLTRGRMLRFADKDIVDELEASMKKSGLKTVFGH